MRAHLRRGLFGGALFTAGLAPLAAAQQFVFVTNNGGAEPVTHAYAYATDIPGIGSFDREEDTNFTPGTALTSVNAQYHGFSAGTSVSATRLDIFAYAGDAYGTGHCFATGYMHFTVSEHATMCFFWNFTDEAPPAYFTQSYLEFRHLTLDTNLLSVAEGDPASDVVCIDVAPGALYAVLAGAFAFEPGGSTVLAVTLEPGGCPGDCDGSGAVNVDDIQCFVASFLDACD